MSTSDPLRHRLVRLALLAVVAATYTGLSGCERKTVVEEGRGHPDYHYDDHHDEHRDHY